MSFKLSDLEEHNSELLKLLTEHLPDRAEFFITLPLTSKQK